MCTDIFAKKLQIRTLKIFLPQFTATVFIVAATTATNVNALYAYRVFSICAHTKKRTQSKNTLLKVVFQQSI